MPEAKLQFYYDKSAELTSIYNSRPLTFTSSNGVGRLWINVTNNYFNFSISTNGGTTWSARKYPHTTVDIGTHAITGSDANFVFEFTPSKKSVMLIGDNTTLYGLQFKFDNCLDDEAKYTVSGNPLSMIVGANENYATLPESDHMPNLGGYFYANLFEDETDLIDASQLALNIHYLSKGCYKEMFKGCSGLTKAPVLPSTSLFESCYEGMFYECTSLLNPPELPAVYMADKCYKRMFTSCTSLLKAPKLEAIELAEECYYEMFAGCNGITITPSLPNDCDLYDRCFYGMFNGCNLYSSPNLYYGNNAEESCAEMFANNTNLSIAGSLYGSSLATGCFRSMYENCVSLTDAPSLHWIELNAQCPNCYQDMFKGCSKLEYIKALFRNSPLSNEQYPWTSTWVQGVAEYGLFIQDDYADWEILNENAIPVKWRIHKEGDDIPIYYKLILSVSPENSGTVTSTFGTWPEGDTVPLTATPASGWFFKGWYKNNTLRLSNSSSYDYTMPRGDTYITGRFAELHPTITAVPNNSVWGSCTGGGTYDYGDDCTLTATPAAGCEFLRWEIDGTQYYTASVTITVEKSMTCTAVFVELDEDYNELEFTIRSNEDNNKLYFYCIPKCGEDDNTVFTLQYTTDGVNWSSVTGNRDNSLTKNPAYWTDRYILPDEQDSEIRAAYICTLQSNEICRLKMTVDATSINYIFNNINLITTFESVDSCFMHILCTQDYIIYGNIASLVAGDDFLDPEDIINELMVFPWRFNCVPLWHDDTTTYSVEGSLLRANHVVFPNTMNIHEPNQSLSYTGVGIFDFPKLGYYSQMFQNNEKMVFGPENLICEVIAPYAYSNMFENCKSLTNTPTIKGNYVDKWGCAQMFMYCESITQMNTLPAKILGEGCYFYMFNGCSNLHMPPNLPATNLVKQCYKGMFANCYSLYYLPEFVYNNTVLKEGCFERMFANSRFIDKDEYENNNNKINNNQSIHLYPSNLHKNCYAYMFDGCNVTEIIIDAYVSHDEDDHVVYGNDISKIRDSAVNNMLYLHGGFSSSSGRIYTNVYVKQIDDFWPPAKDVYETWYSPTYDKYFSNSTLIQKGLERIMNSNGNRRINITYVE